MASEPKRRKIDQPRSRRSVASCDAKNDKGPTAAGGSQVQVQVAVGQNSGVNLRIQQGQNFAVAQAQQDGCTGNYRIFDSPFGNFLMPVIPTRAELN